MISSKLQQQKNIVMSLNLMKKKLRRKNWNLCDLRSDPDPHQNDTDPNHCSMEQYNTALIGTQPRQRRDTETLTLG